MSGGTWSRVGMLKRAMAASVGYGRLVLIALLQGWRSRTTRILAVYPAHRKNVAMIDAVIAHIST